MKRGIALVCVMVMTGCAYQVKPVAPGAINVYSSYESKVPGKFVVVYDDSLRNVSREIRPVSHVCSAHTYPLDAGDSLVNGLRKMFDATLQETREAKTLPSLNEMQSDGTRAAILVRLEDLSVRLSCSLGFWSGTCTSTTDMSMSVSAKNSEGKNVFDTQVTGSKTVDGDSGGACDKANELVEESFTRSARDALERLAERIANAARLRPKQ